MATLDVKFPLSQTMTTTIASRVFGVEDLAGQIATHLVAISQESAVALAQTCRALEVPALSALWVTKNSLNFLITRILPADACCFCIEHTTELYQIVSHLFSLAWDRVLDNQWILNSNS